MLLEKFQKHIHNQIFHWDKLNTLSFDSYSLFNENKKDFFWFYVTGLEYRGNYTAEPIPESILKFTRDIKYPNYSDQIINHSCSGEDDYCETCHFNFKDFDNFRNSYKPTMIALSGLFVFQFLRYLGKNETAEFVITGREKGATKVLVMRVNGETGLNFINLR